MKRGITPIIAVILLLLMTVAAAGAAYLWLTKIQGMMTESITGNIIGSQRAQGTKFCIDEPSNSTDRIVFTLRNCGSYDVTPAEFAATAYYIDTVKTACTPDVTTAFNSYDIRVITCPPGSYGTCTPEKGCPRRTIKVTNVYGTADTVTYQYTPT